MLWLYRDKIKIILDKLKFKDKWTLLQDCYYHLFITGWSYINYVARLFEHIYIYIYIYIYIAGFQLILPQKYVLRIYNLHIGIWLAISSPIIIEMRWVNKWDIGLKYSSLNFQFIQSHISYGLKSAVNVI